MNPLCFVTNIVFYFTGASFWTPSLRQTPAQLCAFIYTLPLTHRALTHPQGPPPPPGETPGPRSLTLCPDRQPIAFARFQLYVVSRLIQDQV